MFLPQLQQDRGSLCDQWASSIHAWWVAMLCSVCRVVILGSCELSRRLSLAPKPLPPCSGECSSPEVFTRQLQSLHCNSRKRFAQRGPKPHSVSGTSVSDIETESVVCQAVTEQQRWMRVSAVTRVIRMPHSSGLHEKELPQCLLLRYTMLFKSTLGRVRSCLGR